MIAPGRTLYFVLLPDGMDPDDVVRSRGPQAMREMLESARPLVDLLWTREVEAEPLDTPERRAGFEARLMAAVATIKDAGVRRAYERELKDRLYWHFRGRNRGHAAKPGQNAANGAAPGVVPTWKKGESPGPTGLPGLRLVVRALESPLILEDSREELFKAEFADPVVEQVRKAAFEVYESAEMLDRAGVAAHLRILGHKRAAELLETFQVGPPMDPRSSEGRDWLDAIRRFHVARTLAAEARAASAVIEGGEPLATPAQEARRKARVVARKKAGLSISEQLPAGAMAKDGAVLREAIDIADEAFGRSKEIKSSED
jgi:DNA primase